MDLWQFRSYVFVPQRRPKDYYNLSSMTQDERWLAKYEEIMAFMAQNHRRPSQYNMAERNNWNWIWHQQKVMGKGDFYSEGIESFEKLLDL